MNILEKHPLAADDATAGAMRPNPFFVKCGCSVPVKERFKTHLFHQKLYELKMTEVDYEYECKRAELLGIPKPDRETFFSNPQLYSREPGETTTENENSEVNKKLDEDGEKIDREGGGLDEINNILSVTQKKINQLKRVCGSLTSIFSLRAELGKTNASSKTTEAPSDGETNEGTSSPDQEGQEPEAPKECTPSSARKVPHGDLESTVGMQLNKLDVLITKAEKADIALTATEEPTENKDFEKR